MSLLDRISWGLTRGPSVGHRGLGSCRNYNYALRASRIRLLVVKLFETEINASLPAPLASDLVVGENPRHTRGQRELSQIGCPCNNTMALSRLLEVVMMMASVTHIVWYTPTGWRYKPGIQ